MKKLLSLVITAALIALPFASTHADGTCDRVQNDVRTLNAADLGALVTEHYGIPPEEIDHAIEYQVVQSPVTGEACAVTWSQYEDTAPGNIPPGGRCVIIVLGVELGIIGITFYVIYRHYNPPPPDPNQPDWEMYMNPDGTLRYYGKPLIN